MPPTSDTYDLEILAQNYLETSDLDFELQVLKYLKSISLRPHHGGRYQDPATQKYREYDFKVRLPPIFHGGTLKHPFQIIEAAIECKSIKQEHPIVVGVRECDDESVSYLGIDMARDGSRPTCYHRHLPMASMARLFQSFGAHFVTHIGVEVAQVHAVRKPQKDAGKIDKTAFHDKWGQAISHSQTMYKALIAEIATSYRRGEVALWCPPIIVVPDGRLFLAWHDESGVRLVPSNGVVIKAAIEFAVPETDG